MGFTPFRKEAADQRDSAYNLEEEELLNGSQDSSSQRSVPRGRPAPREGADEMLNDYDKSTKYDDGRELIRHDDSFHSTPKGSGKKSQELELKSFSSKSQRKLQLDEEDDGCLSTDRELSPERDEEGVDVDNLLYAARNGRQKGENGSGYDDEFDEEQAMLTIARVPNDPHNLSYWLFFIQGMGMLFPWNSFINAGPYFKDKLASTPYAQFIENDFELTFQVSHLVVLMLSVRYQHLFSTFSRTIYPLYGQGAIFSILMIMVAFNGNIAFFWITVILSFLAGGATSVFQSGMFGLGGMLPFKYTQAIMAGQSAGAVIVAVFYIAFLEIMPNNNYSGLAFFAMAVIFIAVCLWSCYILQRRPIVLHYMKKSERDKALDKDGKVSAPDFAAILRRIGIFRAPFLLSCVAITYAVTLSVFPGLADAIRGSDGWYTGEDCDMCNCWDVHNEFCKCFDNSDGTAAEDCLSYLDFSSSMGEQCFASRDFSESCTTDNNDVSGHFDPWVFFINQTNPCDNDFATDELVMTCEAGSCCSTVCDEIGELEDDACKDCEAGSLWVPVCVFLLFNVGEVIGRTLIGWVQLIPSSRLAYFSAARIVFLPLFMLCRYKRSYIPSPFQSDAFPIIFMLLFAITNGITGSLAMMYGPEQVEPKDRETAGSMMVTALTVGLNSGSFLSYALKAAVTHESPF